MQYEKSCGIIPFYKKNNELHVVLIKQNNGVIGFPKGHVEPNESEEETASRECFEETNLKPTLVKGFREETTYYMAEYDATKTVVLFIGLIESLDIKKQISEVADIYLCDIKTALEKISFEDSKTILKKAVSYLKDTLTK